MEERDPKNVNMPDGSVTKVKTLRVGLRAEGKNNGTR